MLPTSPPPLRRHNAIHPSFPPAPNQEPRPLQAVPTQVDPMPTELDLPPTQVTPEFTHSESSNVRSAVSTFIYSLFPQKSTDVSLENIISPNP